MTNTVSSCCFFQPAVETPVYHYAPSYQYTAPVVTHPVPVSVPAAAPEVVPEVKSEELVDLHTGMNLRGLIKNQNG